MELDPSLDRDIPVLDWVPHLAMRTQGMKSSAIREILKLTQNPEVISFAGGLPAPELFPVQELIAVSAEVQRQLGPVHREGVGRVGS